MLATAEGVWRSDGPVELAGQPVRALAGDGASGGHWAIVGGHRVARRSPGGTWVDVAGTDDEATCLAVAGPGRVLVGTAGAHLHGLDGGGDGGQLRPVTGFEAAEGRGEWYTPWGGPPDTRSLAVGGDGAIYANVHVGGILRSADGGGHWAATIDLHTDVHQVICPWSDRPEVVLAACADGLVQSRDGGATWRLRDDGLDRTYSRALAVVGDTVVMSTSEGPRGTRARVYRGPVEGWARLERCRDGLPEWFDGNVDTGWLATAGDVVALASPEGRVFVSSDQGRSWALAASGLAAPSFLVAA